MNPATFVACVPYGRNHVFMNTCRAPKAIVVVCAQQRLVDKRLPMRGSKAPARGPIRDVAHRLRFVTSLIEIPKVELRKGRWKRSIAVDYDQAWSHPMKPTAT